jgi:hypothetical protein
MGTGTVKNGVFMQLPQREILPTLGRTGVITDEEVRDAARRVRRRVRTSLPARYRDAAAQGRK